MMDATQWTDNELMTQMGQRLDALKTAADLERLEDELEVIDAEIELRTKRVAEAADRLQDRELI